jgi:hypothetical protein
MGSTTSRYGCASHWPVLPTSRLFGRITQNGQNKNWLGGTNLWPNFGQFGTEWVEKGPSFRKGLLFFFSYSLSGSRKV